MSKNTCGRPAMRRCAEAIAAGNRTRVEIRRATGLAPGGVHHACKALMAREWIVNIASHGNMGVYELAVPLEEILAALRDARTPRPFDCRPLLECWPLPLTRVEERAQ